MLKKWSVKSSEFIDHLLTFATCDDRHIAGTRTAVEDDRSLHPGDEEVCPLSTHSIFYTLEAVKNNCSVSSVHCMHHKAADEFFISFF